MKKILKTLLPFTILGVASSMLPLLLTACNKTEDETQYLIDLYKNRIGKVDDDRPTDADGYFSLWKNLLNDKTEVGQEQLSWCIEYSSFGPILFEKNLHILTGNETSYSISLKDDQTLWDLIENNTLLPKFQTSKVNGIIDPNDGNNLLLSYTGVLHLVVNKEFVVDKSNGSGQPSDMSLQVNDQIEILLAYNNLSLNTNTIIVPDSMEGQYISQALTPTYGNGIGLSSIYQSNTLLGSSSIPKIDKASYTNINSLADFFEG